LSKEDREKYSDFSNVEKQRNYVTAEDLPDGPYGSPIGKHEPTEGKSTPWREGQRSYSNFNYEFKSLHQGMPRQEAGAHPTHDDPDESEQKPYSE
jgi:hypothetical protein